MSERRFTTPHGGPPNAGTPPDQQHRPNLVSPFYMGPPPPFAVPATPGPVYTGPSHPWTVSAPDFGPVAPFHGQPSGPPPPPPPPAAAPQPTPHHPDHPTLERIQGHTIIHFVERNQHPWEYSPFAPLISPRQVPHNLTVAELMNRLGCSQYAPDDSVSVTECLEMGDGRYVKGQIIKKSDPKASMKLSELGWDESRGTRQKPTFLASTGF